MTYLPFPCSKCGRKMKACNHGKVCLDCQQRVERRQDSDAILKIQVDEGWTDATLLGVLLNYVDSKQSDGLRFVQRRAT